MSDRSSILKSAAILTAAGLITRVLGFVYRIYMSNAIGAEGMGLYQLIMPLYSLAWSIACSGITTTVSKLVAAENAKKQFGNTGRIIKIAMGLTLTLSILVMCMMLFGADFIGLKLFNEPRTIMPIKILALAIPFMAAGSGIRGYFTGLSEMRVPAVSQVLEQCVRMGAIYLAAQAMAERGLEYACASAVIGILAGEVLSFLYVLYKYNSRRMKRSFDSRIPDTGVKTILTTIVTMALPLTLNRITGSLLATAENILIPRSLQAFGMTSGEAIAEFGRISGMALPLIFFPSAFLMSLSTSIVPAVSEAVTINKIEHLSGVLSKALLFTILIGIGSSAVFMTLPSELGLVFYNQDIGGILLPLAFICPLWYINITVNGILNGLGAMSAIFRNNLVSSAINILFIIFLVPLGGINSFILGWFISITLQVTLGILRIRKQVSLPFPILNRIIKPLLAGTAAGLASKLVSRRLIFPNTGEITGLIISLTLIITLYLSFIIILDVISADDLLKALKRFKPSERKPSCGT